MLTLDLGMYCLAKKSLNRFALSKKSVTSLLSTSSGGISGILLPFTNVFKMAQYVLGVVSGSLSCHYEKNEIRYEIRVIMKRITRSLNIFTKQR